MRLVDPLALKYAQPRSKVVFSTSQEIGKKETQEDYFTNFNDECFVLADGVGGAPHGEVAAKLAVETAIWGYKHIRQYRFYWLDKKRFLCRIFRSTNLAIWQKHREPGGEECLTTMLVLMLGSQRFWAGNVGDSSLWLLRQGKLTKVTKDDVDSRGRLTKVLGTRRLGLIPLFHTDRFFIDDTLLLATDGVASYLTEGQMKSALIDAGTTNESVTTSVMNLLDAAKQNGSNDNMTACIIKRITLDKSSSKNLFI